MFKGVHHSEGTVHEQMNAQPLEDTHVGKKKFVPTIFWHQKKGNNLGPWQCQLCLSTCMVIHHKISKCCPAHSGHSQRHSRDRDGHSHRQRRTLLEFIYFHLQELGHPLQPFHLVLDIQSYFISNIKWTQLFLQFPPTALYTSFS